VKKKDIVPEEVSNHVAVQEITHDFVLEIYEKAKRARKPERKKALHDAAEELSKHVGKWLVE
jgi:hypothetical protein